MLPSEEENTRCWEYVMNFSMGEILANGHSELNQLCSKYIDSKQSFIHYTEEKRKSTRSNSHEKNLEEEKVGGVEEVGKVGEEKKKEEVGEKEPFRNSSPILGRNFIRKS
jgi:hypothetical protein